MLKRLELVGFKSFADKTQFDFPAGVTAIVGPNGSGKSNVVDAVRWVLGEQSAKSLRGGEMADVIFNGSTSRRGLGLAEVTMTFDNARRHLATESEEVQITRRVYRDGEGEYLINQQPSRLRDIKDLFLGSGAGNDAYSIIEQGRVEGLLQASTKERRVIFEEAAGISRFKAKKVETARKLEKVDQNLDRVRDINEEVEKQLRSVKLQAAKAQRYQEHTERLKELRLGLGVQEYHGLTSRLEAAAALLDATRADLGTRAEEAEQWGKLLQELEHGLTALDAAVHEQEARLAQVRQVIAAEESTLTHESALGGDLEQDLTRTRRRLRELSGWVAALTEGASRADEEVRGVEAQCERQRADVTAIERALRDAAAQTALLQKQVALDKTEHLEQMRQTAKLQNDSVSHKAQVDNLRREADRLRFKTEQANEHLASLDMVLRELTEADDALQGKLNQARLHLAEQRNERDRLTKRAEELGDGLANMRAERSGLVSRVEVLEKLESSQEGLGTGVREMSALLRRNDPGPWQTVVGMVADLLTVRREYAPLIDIALGERSQHFVVRDGDTLEEALRSRGQPFSGRVSFLPLLSQGVPHADAIESTGDGGKDADILAVAADVVHCERGELAELPGRLLARTLIVRDLAASRRLATKRVGCRFLTLQGELLETDGTLTIGTHHAETGILSRKTELREVRLQIVALDRQLLERETELQSARDQLSTLESQTEQLQKEMDVLKEQSADLRSRLFQHREKRETLNEELRDNRREISSVEKEIESLLEAWKKARSQAEASEQAVQALQRKLEQADQALREGEHLRRQREQEGTVAKVALAQAEERLTALKSRYQQLEADLQQRQRERAQGEQQTADALARLEESQHKMLRASATLAEAYLEKETAELRLMEHVKDRDLQRARRQELADKSLAARSAWQVQQEQAHKHELETNELRHRRAGLCDRIREDYQLELASHYEENKDRLASAEPLDADKVNEEVAELRKKLSRLGAVNMDSLQELADLEARAKLLQEQFADLVAAKKSLEEIIDKINQDSRRLFSDTFAAIREHFQELFRKLFGGGMADIVPEDETDILECGIDIIARPPGKELRSISLMSGGEKTMTAVALLLAIFRSKPSPFCILDEVDAALDEANIGRFTGVLRDFMDRSQFIIITHSKRTMAAADVLYGVTMQESGISKRVAVRFEDWPDDAQKPQETVPRDVA